MTDVEASGTAASDRPGARSVLRLLSALPGRRDDAIAIVNGLFGDTLDERGSRLATRMTIRHGNIALPLDRSTEPGELAEVIPAGGTRICLLVHGLMSTESIWSFPNDPSTNYATQLADEHDMTVLSVRYNTGRHISTNGRELAHLLALLTRAWPVPVREINLIGHSMGGLVVRSACHYGRMIWPRGRRSPFGRRWTSKVRRVVLIGVPNGGAGLEAFVNAASAALWALPIPATRLVGLGLDRRSAGIKDLRFGAIHDEDWLEQDPGARHRIHPHRPHRARWLRRVNHLVIAGSVTDDPEHPVARLIGDALVTSASAHGFIADRELFGGATIRIFPKATHNALAHHRDVHEAIDEWW